MDLFPKLVQVAELNGYHVEARHLHYRPWKMYQVTLFPHGKTNMDQGGIQNENCDWQLCINGAIQLLKMKLGKSFRDEPLA